MTLYQRILSQGPAAAVAFILRNNLEAVQRNLIAAGYPATTPDDTATSLETLLANDPDTFQEVLSVPIIPANLTTRERSELFDAVERASGTAILKSGGADDDNDAPPDAVSIDDPVSSGDGNSWSWNEFASLIVGAGLEVYHNEQGGGASLASTTPTPAQRFPWVWVGVAVAALVVAFILFRKR